SGLRRINMFFLSADYCRPGGGSSPLLKIRSADLVGCPVPQKDSGEKHRSKSASAWFTMRDGMIPLLSIIALGFFLGMRHATDADHVVAVTTIVSRERTIRSSALIGILWGLGHTITIFIVGSLIILFGVVIPPRLGLTMELSVGLMLILLGILNLSGMMKWIARNFAGGHDHSHSHEGEGGHSHSPVAETRDGDAASSLGWMDRTFGRIGLYQMLRPLVVGVVHGLA